MPAWDYIGQTGSGTMNLRKRMVMLKGIYADQMPYRDPHTAGPGLWALRHQAGEPFEIALCPVVGTTPWRKGLEAVAIAVYRQEHGASPTVNFGRMPPGYRMSSANNAKLVAAQKRFRGGPCDDIEESHGSGIPPIASLDPDITDPAWCGHAWTAWAPMTPEGIGAIGPGTGLYRIGGNTGLLVYIGEGSIRARLAAHAAKLRTDSPQAQALSANAPLEFSTAPGRWLRHQRVELETDLIAAHVLATQEVPVAQFIG